MRITADTNLLVRVAVRDDENQARIALELLKQAESVVISLPCLCEFVWVLESVYRLSRDKIAASVRTLMQPANTLLDESAVNVGLSVLEAGGDFADGIIAAAGRSLGGETFVSFDRKAVARLEAVGIPARHARDFA